MCAHCAFQVASTVFHVCSLAKQEILRRLGDTEEEAALCRLENPVLHHPEFDLKNLLELLLAQRMEDDHPCQCGS